VHPVPTGAHFCFAWSREPAMSGDRQSASAGACVIKNAVKDNARIIAPIVAVGVATAAASVAAVPGVAGWLGAGLALIMLAIAAVDARYFIIPDALNAAGLALGLVHAVMVGEGSAIEALALAALRAAALALVFLALRLIYARLRGRQGLGLGDVKLAAVAGAWLGWNAIPVAIEIAAVSALAVYAPRHYLLRRPLRATTRLPFGLFFAPAIWLGWLLDATVLPYWYG
jgi:leader peptidase (prepilin peptidase) / N-methyltransferase